MPFKKIEQLEKERGSLHQVIPALVNKHGQIRAGQALGVSATTINQWLKRNGYRRIMRYERVESGERAS